MRALASHLAALLAFLLFLVLECGPSQRVQRLELLSLERTTCLGWCPSYRVVVFGDGRVEYEGRRYVKETGKRLKELSPEKLQALVAEINRVRYLDLRDRYARPEDGCAVVWTDHPAVITSVRADGKVKTVHHYHGCRERNRGSVLGESYPPGLAEFEDGIDTIVGTAQWIGSEQDRARIVAQQDRQ